MPSHSPYIPSQARYTGLMLKTALLTFCFTIAKPRFAYNQYRFPYHYSSGDQNLKTIIDDEYEKTDPVFIPFDGNPLTKKDIEYLPDQVGLQVDNEKLANVS